MNIVDELARKYSNGIANVEELEGLGCTVFHGVNVHSMTLDYRLARDRYDRIVFNFPHSGLGFGSEHASFYIMYVLQHFFFWFFSSFFCLYSTFAFGVYNSQGTPKGSKRIFGECEKDGER